MERLRNNEPSTPDSYDQTIHIFSDHEPEPIINPEEIDILVRQFEEEVNECLHSLMQECTKCVNPTQSDYAWSEFER